MKEVDFSDHIRIHTLPIMGLDIALEITLKAKLYNYFFLILTGLIFIPKFY